MDCDGLLADTEPAWGRATSRLLAAFGIGVDDAALTEQLTGVSLAETVLHLSRLVGAGSPGPEELERRLLDLFRQDLAEHGATAMPGARELLRRLAPTTPVAVVSNSPRALVGDILRHTGLLPYVRVVVGAHGSCRPKPAPDPYLTGCSLLGVAPEHCLALEDSPTGARAAVAAGLRVTVVPPPGVHPAEYPPGVVHLATLLDADAAWQAELTTRHPIG
ncbi:HAD family hydrolase [Streptacidiphilus cavernicola]|uniref:HAD family hydrolase n=1 Tax=Streptacidiphilus cavernicola TaxID=3342716 RepID=UPI0036D4178C